MIIQTKTLQDNCKKILDAVTSTTGFSVTETLELEVKNGALYLNVTNKDEYFVSVKTPIDYDEDFHVVVGAKLFLNLISKLTTNEVDLRASENVLTIKANGNYRLPLICDEEGNIASLTKIEIDNVTNSFVIPNTILQSIIKYNSKELLKKSSVSEVHKLFYIDNEGALTFSNGASVNSFTLEQPVNIFLNEKTVKLFKLFKSDVTFYIGHDMIAEFDRIFTKVAFTDGNISIVSVLKTEEKVTNTFPVKVIRQLAFDSYAHNVTFDKDAVLDAINRLSLFASKDGYSNTYIVFGNDAMTIYDANKDNYEVIPYPNTTLYMEEEYHAKFNTLELKLTLESCDEKYVNLGFGNRKAAVFSRGNVKNIIPEQK